MELNYYLKFTLHQLEVCEPCPGCGMIDQLAVREIVISYFRNRTDYYIGCNCGWHGPAAINPIVAAAAWDIRNNNRERNGD
jgi:hypothetical protein